MTEMPWVLLDEAVGKTEDDDDDAQGEQHEKQQETLWETCHIITSMKPTCVDVAPAAYCARVCLIAAAALLQWAHAFAPMAPERAPNGPFSSAPSV